MKDSVKKWERTRAKGKTKFVIKATLFMTLWIWVVGSLLTGLFDRLISGTPPITINFDGTNLIILLIISVPLSFYFWWFMESTYKEDIVSMSQEEPTESE